MISAAPRRAKRLQFRNRFANIIERYIICDLSSAYLPRHNESDFSAFELFVELHRADYFVPRKILRQTRRQIESLQNLDHRIALCVGESSPFN